MASKEIFVPDLGDFKDVAVIEVLVKPGDSVQVDAPLLTLETEKATMDVPSTDAGVIEKVHVAKGTKVSSGTLIATLQLAAGAAAPASSVPATATPSAPKPAPPATPVAPAASAKPAEPATPAVPTATVVPAASAAASAVPGVTEQGFARAHAGPSVRRFARELGVDLGRVRGTGQKGRVTDADVKAFVKSLMVPGAGPAVAGGAGGGALPKVNVPDFAQFGPIDIKPLGRVQRISGARLHASWVNLPHVTQFDEADVTELEETRRALKAKADSAGIKLTTLAFIVRACVKALQQFPLFNSSIDASGENLVYKKYIHIGFAADTPNGLLVPVIRDADRKDIYEIARALGELSARARSGKLAGAEMQGGSFTISSLGGIGGTAFTPIINAPEVAILGVSRASMKAVYRDDAFVPRMILPLSLSYDHRVIDGANGARFTSYLAKILGDAPGLTEAVP
ncbi:MAG TPA: 2-oxo acid dehydrogenase subunit E2 [Steroidobacteraceae bacterium]|nr:2-oxo acid dehydrogenase subunit E2 [Steroidobacteraceae bacterium]